MPNNLIPGPQLSPAARQEALASFGYRWTADNPHRLRFYQPCPSCDIRRPVVNATTAKGHNHPTIPLVTDQEWLESHAFYVVKDGSRLDRTRKYCVPEYPAW